MRALALFSIKYPFLNQLVNSPLRRPIQGNQGGDGSDGQRSTRTVTANADCLSYLIKRLKEQEGREKQLMAELEAMKFRGNLLKQEVEEKDSIIAELKSRCQRCTCHGKSRNHSRGDTSLQNELGSIT